MQGCPQSRAESTCPVIVGIIRPCVHPLVSGVQLLIITEDGNKRRPWLFMEKILAALHGTRVTRVAALIICNIELSEQT